MNIIYIQYAAKSRLPVSITWIALPYNDPELRQLCHRHGCELVATRRSPAPPRDGGGEVRQGFHKLWASAMEPCNGSYKNVCAWRVKMPAERLQRSQLLALGAVVVYQLVLRYQYEQRLPLGQGMKPRLRAA